MLAEERQRVILRVLEEKRAATVAVLCQETGASEATIRRDLNELDRQGKLNKVHGGAVLPVSEFESQGTGCFDQVHPVHRAEGPNRPICGSPG